MRKIFVDTNVLVDLICSREPFVQDAQLLFALRKNGNVLPGISALSVINTVYISKKYGFSQSDVKDRLLKIADFTVVCDLLGGDIIGLLSSDWSDYEDSTQYACAVNFQADIIVTRNNKDFSSSTIPVQTVKELLMKLLPNFDIGEAGN